MNAFADCSYWPTELPYEASEQAVSEKPRRVAPVVSPPSTASLPPWHAQTEQRIIELSRLGENWDQRGSAAVSRDALAFSWSVLGQVMGMAAPAPSIIPLGHGGVQLTWLSPTTEIEVEVIQPNEVIIFHFDRASGVEDERPATTDFSKLAELLKSAFAQP